MVVIAPVQIGVEKSMVRWFDGRGGFREVEDPVAYATCLTEVERERWRRRNKWLWLRFRLWLTTPWRLFLCKVFGHAWVSGGVGGILEFPCCVRCGKWER
jgi:hypothetical protein